MADWNKIGRALGGFAAGYGGTGGQYLETLQRADEMKLLQEEKKKKEAQERQQMTEARAANNIRMARERLKERPEAALPAINELIMGIPGADQGPLGKVKQSLMTAMTTGNGALQPGMREQLLAQADQQLRALDDSFVSRGILKPETAPSPVTLAKGSQLIDPTTGQVRAENRDESVDYNKPFLPDGSPNTAYQQYTRGNASAGAPQTNISMGEDWRTERMKQDTQEIQRRLESARTSYSNLNEIDRFMAASASGGEGGLENFRQGVRNFLTSFGIESDKLKDFSEMSAATSTIQANMMNQLGARGLTDEDMKIIKNFLPQAGTSREAREEIGNVLRKSYATEIQSYVEAARWEEETYGEDANFLRPSWYGRVTRIPSQEEYDAIPVGHSYWVDGVLRIKTGK